MNGKAGKPRSMFQENYVLSKKIGSGNFSIVRQCRHKYSKSVYAAKILDVKGTRDECSDSFDMIKVEISAMRKLKHDYITQFVDAFLEPDRVIIITELSELGDLREFVINNPEKLNEVQIRLFAVHVASAISYMHSLHIVHRDIKPENFLLFKSKKEENHSLKLCDFGLAEEIPTYGGLTRICGSPSFVAPEILEGKTYGLAVDVWSMGILLYFMLSQGYPFEHTELNLLFNMIMKSDFNFESPKWVSISDNAKNLISDMLNKNPKQRVSSNEVLHHPWFHEKTFNTDASDRKKLSFKTATIVVAGANILQKYDTCKLPRENAILSRGMLENLYASCKK